MPDARQASRRRISCQLESVLVNRSPQPRAAPSAEAVKVRFLIVGVWNTLFGLLVFSLADVTIGRVAGYLASVSVMFALAVPQAHLAQRVWVWRSHAPYLAELFRFSWVFVVAYVVNVVLLAFAVEVLDAPTLPSQIVISGLIAVSTYVIHRTWTFRHGHVAARSGAPVSVTGPALRPQDTG